MTPHDHHDQRETTVSPQALVRDLRAQEGALPEALRRQFMAAGAAGVPALIALLEAALADDQPEPEGAPFHGSTSSAPSGMGGRSRSCCGAWSTTTWTTG